MNETSLDCKILDRLIVGRVQPRIYAFSTNTVPSFLKVGDTYRPVATRLLEWKRHYPDLEKKFEDKAIVSDNVYFRDYAVHKFLEADLGKSRLSKEQMGEGMYYSREFFADTSATDVRQAIDEIVRSHDKNIGRYDYYDASKRLQKEYRYERGADWTLRPNQEEAVNNFLEALNSGRKNLLMFAVMRFGKSFTSLCCAKAMDANVVLVLSAKADVKSEWKKTTEAAGNFDKFTFLDSTNLLRDARAIENVRAKGETAVVFLTLQDLQGSELKEKHREIFESQIDLLIVDETHFGARAEAFGRVLKNVGQKPDDTQALKRDVADHVQPDEADAQIKELNARVRLHLSGTPYRILMGSEFSKEDIISFVQFSDIVREQEQWDCDNLDKDEVNEWDNPYFGFPQMIRVRIQCE